MLVDLKNNWFAPGGDVIKNGRPFSGVRFRKGEQEIPEEYRKDIKALVKKGKAKILDEESVPVEKKPTRRQEDTLAHYDSYRKAADEEIRVRKEMSEENKQKARERVAKAREARLAKLAKKREEEAKAA